MDSAQITRLYDRLSEISERIARVETMLQTRVAESERINATLDEHDSRLSALEERTAKAFGVKEFAAWAIAIAISVWGVMK